MSDTHEHDLVSGAFWGSLFSGVGSFVRAIQTPQTKRQYISAVCVGLLFGGISAVVFMWQYPSQPFELVIAASAFIGFVSLHMSELVIKITDRVFLRIGSTIDSRMDAAGWKPEDNKEKKEPGKDDPQKSSIAS